MGGGGGGNSGPTVQQQQLEKQQAMTSAEQNLQENEQRKTILNSMFGTRVFRGSALSRAVRGNTPGTGGATAGPASASQVNASVVAPRSASLLDLVSGRSTGTGATPSGGAGASGGGIGGVRGPGSGRGQIP